MPVKKLQSGIGDNNDLLVRLVSNNSDSSAAVSIYPEIHNGSYYLYNNNSAEIQEFQLLSNPTALQLNSVEKDVNGLITIPLVPIPDIKIKPYAIISSNNTITPLEIVHDNKITEEHSVTTYTITKQVDSIDTSDIIFIEEGFPRNVIIGSVCFHQDFPDEQYIVQSITDTTISLNKDVPVLNIGSWVFSVYAIALMYPKGTPSLLTVLAYDENLVSTVIASEDYYYDADQLILILPSDIDLDYSIVVTYYADNTCSYLFNGSSYFLSIYTSVDIDSESSATIHYSYQKGSTSQFRSFSDVELNPAISGIHSGFIHITGSVNIPAKVEFSTYPGPNKFYYINGENAIVYPITVVAQILDENDNFCPNIDVVWFFSKNSGVPIEIDTLTTAGVTATTKTNTGGFISLSVDSDFILSKAFINPESYDTIEFSVKSNGSFIANSQEASSTNKLLGVRFLADTPNTYLHTVVEKTETNYAIASWQESLQNSSEWRRLYDESIVKFYGIDKNSNVTELKSDTNVSEFSFNTAFPNTAILTLSDLKNIHTVYSETNLSGTKRRSNYVRLDLTLPELAAIKVAAIENTSMGTTWDDSYTWQDDESWTE